MTDLLPEQIEAGAAAIASAIGWAFNSLPETEQEARRRRKYKTGLPDAITKKDCRDAAKAAIAAYEATRTPPALQASDNRLVDALEEIKQRCEAYPESVFSEPDLEAVATVLKQAGMLEQMDRMHASWARKILADQGEIAAAALKDIGR